MSKKNKKKKGKKRKHKEIKNDEPVINPDLGLGLDSGVGVGIGIDIDIDIDIPSKKVKVQKKKKKREIRKIPTVRNISNLPEYQKSQLYTLLCANNNNNNNNDNEILQKIVDYLWNIGICCVCIDRIIGLRQSSDFNNNNNDNNNDINIIEDKTSKKDMFNPSFFEHILACIELNQQLTTADLISKKNDTYMDVDHEESQNQFVSSPLPPINESYCYICNGTYIRILRLLPTWYKDIITYEFDEYFTEICIPFWHVLRDFSVITHLQYSVDGCKIILPEKNRNSHIVYLLTLINQYFWQQKKEEVERKWKWDTESLFRIKIKIFNDVIKKTEKPSQLIDIAEEKKENIDNEKNKNFIQKIQPHKKKSNTWVWPELYFMRLFLQPSDESIYARHASFLNGHPNHLFYAKYEKLHDILINIDSHCYLSWILPGYKTDDYTYDTSYQIINPSVYFKCKYFKYDRQISQSPRTYPHESISSVILNILKSFNVPNDNGKLWCECAYALLHGSGGEDNDVRILGDGRPGVLELVYPKRNIKNIFDKNKNLAEQIEKFINSDEVYNQGRIGIQELAISNIEECNDSRKIAKTKKKAHRCVCWLSEPLSLLMFTKRLKEIQNMIDANQGLIIEQTTPIRVLSRLSPIIRKNKLYALNGTWINPHWCYIDILTAGIYIKEFINGDRGRTIPHLAFLFRVKQAQIIQMDFIGLYD